MLNYKELSRPLDISDIDFRVQSINNGGYATILAYKDSRVDMNRLDEVLSPIGWQRDYKLIDGKLFCGVGMFHEQSHEWIWKWDVGTESMTEKEKGQASDAFKRACFNLGIGRELYDYPLISVKLLDHEWTKDGGRPKQTFNLKLKEWRWYSEFTDGRISFLAAKDENGKIRFKWGELKPKQEEPTYVPAAQVEKTEEEVAPEVLEALAVVEDEGNVEGLLKKSAEPIEMNATVVVDDVRVELVEKYKSLFGKAPHGRMSTDRIQEEIDAKMDELMNEPTEEAPMAEVPEIEIETEEQEEEEATAGAPLGLDMWYLSQIETFNNAEDFVKWAKECVAELNNRGFGEDSVEAFKQQCNKHYARIK